MISPELIRRYPFFAGLSHDQIVALAKAGEEITVEENRYFFHEGDELSKGFYLVLEGTVAVVIQIPAQDVEQKVSGQLTGKLETSDIALSDVGPGEVFGWSAMISPHQATAGAKAVETSRVIGFDREQLTQAFEEDCCFGYQVLQKVAEVSRDRLQDMRNESLSHILE